MTHKQEINAQDLQIKYLGLVDYEPTWKAMSDFTVNRTAQTPDEIWVLEHRPVFTLGQASLPEHLLNVGDIPVVQTDRGGQVTYHGPGQLVVYPLIDIGRLNIHVREFVSVIENAIIELFYNEFSLTAYAKKDAPGVYVKKMATVDSIEEEVKLASLGLRIKKGASFHGLSINIDMDLEPFSRINPCGYAGMRMENLKNLCEESEASLDPINANDTASKLVKIMTRLLNYQEKNIQVVK